MKKAALLAWIDEETDRMEKHIRLLSTNYSVLRHLRKGVKIESEDFAPGLTVPRKIECVVTLLAELGIAMTDLESKEHYYMPWKIFLGSCTWKLSPK